jgi:glucose-1-phosphate thymidylyltransferase
MINKSIIILGGKGSRLGPSTLSLNKHLFPVFNKPMFFYPLSLMMLAKIRNFLFVVNKGEVNYFKNILGDCKDLGIKVDFVEQIHPRGIPDAISLGKNFTKKDFFSVILGDNFFYGSNLPEILTSSFKKKNIITLTYPTQNPSQFGIIEIDAKGAIKSLEEKPKNPASNLAITGIYVFDKNFYNLKKKLKPSNRNELEIIDILRHYKKKIKNIKLGRGDVWFDLGTYADLFQASNFVKNIEERQSLSVACLEEISFSQGWIVEKNIKNRIKHYGSSSYSDYIKKLI